MFLILLFSLLAEPQTATSYYSRLVFRESPLAPLRGAVALTQAQAAGRNHFKFTTDARGRLVKVAFYGGDKLRPLNDNTNLFFHAPVLHIRYVDDVEIRHYEDHLGNRVLFWGKVFEAHYVSDDSGRRIALSFVDKDGKAVENAWGIAHYTWQYTDAHTIIETRTNLAGEAKILRPGFHFGRLRLEYRPDWLLARMQNIDDSGKLIENDSGAAQDRLEYDRQGLVVAWNVLDKDDNPTEGNSPNVARGVIGYNDMGDEISICHYDRHGQPMVNRYGFCASTTQYDRFGNLVMRTFLDVDGRPTAHEQAGYQSLRMLWDESGMRRLRMSLFGPDGKPIEHQQRGYAEVVSSYDERGQLMRIAFLDRHGQPTTHRGMGSSRIEHRYDASGRRVETAYYDENGTFADRGDGKPSLILYHYDRDGFLASEREWTRGDLEPHPSREPK